MMLPLLLLAMVPRLARSAQDNDDDGGGGDAWLEKGALDPDSGRVCDSKTKTGPCASLMPMLS
jgi:hypothetical protein